MLSLATASTLKTLFDLEVSKIERLSHLEGHDLQQFENLVILRVNFLNRNS
jgi:hypothetical protein